MWKTLFNSPLSAIGTTLTAFFLLLALFGGMFAPYRLNEQDPTAAYQPPSAQHWFGADQLGRDVFSRILHGAGDVLGLAGAGTGLAVVLGTFFGLVSGYQGGWLDEALMRLFDSLLALPALLLALLLLGTLGGNAFSILIVLAAVYTPIVARVVRSVTLGLKHTAYVEAARLRGESLPYILLREILPGVLPALAVESALRFSYSIFLVASLGYLGIGVRPPSANWGLMVSEARDFARQIPWSMYFPVGAIVLLVIGINLFAEALKRTLQGEAE
jgi:peptide/nickel transport system permease protein